MKGNGIHRWGGRSGPLLRRCCLSREVWDQQASTGEACTVGGESSRPCMAYAKALGQEGVDCVGETERRAVGPGPAHPGSRGPGQVPAQTPFHVQDAHVPGPLCVWGVGGGGGSCHCVFCTKHLCVTCRSDTALWVTLMRHFLLRSHFLSPPSWSRGIHENAAVDGTLHLLCVSPVLLFDRPSCSDPDDLAEKAATATSPFHGRGATAPQLACSEFSFLRARPSSEGVWGLATPQVWAADPGCVSSAPRLGGASVRTPSQKGHRRHWESISLRETWPSVTECSRAAHGSWQMVPVGQSAAGRDAAGQGVLCG